MPRKNTFDWMRQQLNGFMRTQIIAAAATLSLADHLQNEPRTVEEIASITGLDRELTFRFLRALATIGLVASEDEHTYYSLPPLHMIMPIAMRGARGTSTGGRAPACRRVATAFASAGATPISASSRLPSRLAG